MVEKKPGGLKDVMAHFGGGFQPADLVVVGDRYSTDVIFGNMHGKAVHDVYFGRTCRVSLIYLLPVFLLGFLLGPGMLTIKTGAITSEGESRLTALVGKPVLFSSHASSEQFMQPHPRSLSSTPSNVVASQD